MDLTRYKHVKVINHPLKEHYLKLQDYVITEDNWFYKNDKWLYNITTKKIHEILEVWEFENTECTSTLQVFTNVHNFNSSSAYIPPT
jgi:hypothetical protein